MSAHVLAFIAIGAVAGAALLVALVTIVNHRRRLVAADRDPQTQRELDRIQEQIDRGRTGSL